MPVDLAGSRVWVCGATGMVGSALCRALEEKKVMLLTPPRADLNLCRGEDVARWAAHHRPDFVFMAAGKVGGIKANIRYPAEFLYENLLMAANVIHASAACGVKKLLYFGSSCIYPRNCPQPMHEDMLLTGAFEPTNEPYALAKMSGVRLCASFRQQYGADFISCLPTNLYGPGDNYDGESAHVPAALIKKFHNARLSGAAEVRIWGTGEARREFLHVDDLADAAIHLMRHYKGSSPINIGFGYDISIAGFAALVKKITGYKGAITFDTDQPEGAPRKLLDISRLSALGWNARISLEEGMAATYRHYCGYNFSSHTSTGRMPLRTTRV